MKFYGGWYWSVIAVLLCAGRAGADVRLPAIFSEHMVLQRSSSVPVWGWASPNEKVTVRIGSSQQSAIADAHGKWRVIFDRIEPSPGHPLEMVVSAANTITVRDILAGEVWLCAGQSNMQWPVRASLEGAKEIADADFPRIRLFKVSRRASAKPEEEASGKWVVCSSKTVGDFSGVGYFFGRELHRALKAPIGLIEASWGGSNGEAWVDAEALRAELLTQPIIDRYEADLPRLMQEYQQYQKKLNDWRELAYAKDPGDTKSALGWAKPDFDDSAWKSVNLPARWEELFGTDFDGSIWFRKEIILPQAWQGKELTLNLGVIDDNDVTWFNGQKVGATSRDLQDIRRQVERTYIVPGASVKAGRNVVAVRVFDMYTTGGLLGPAQNMTLQPRDSSDAAISLAGAWTHEIELQIPKRANLPPQPMEPPGGPNTQVAPANIYNGMIRPLMPYAVKGVAWYHGEMNLSRAYQYRGLLAAQIKSWRREWGVGDIPFLIVQLPNFGAPAQPGQSTQWAEMRDSQFAVARTQPRCALVVTIDLGEGGDIHPRNKQDVGRRLSLAALRNAYGADVFSNGPIFKSARVEGNHIVVSFEASRCGMTARGGKLRGFVVAGEDHRFVAADAAISGETVIVSSAAVARPLAVRYAWGDNPEATLYNSEGLPAIPFRSDDWPGVTFDKR